ncbi:MAG: hypothetical protein V4760_13155 [Bdellovibrionota bacterium]
MHRFILCLCLLMLGFTTSRANAEPQSNFKTIITHDEFKALDSVRQERYVEGLQMLFADWAKLQAEDKMQFQNAGLAKPGSAFASFAMMFGEARAVPPVDQRQCVYAGFISEMDVNGRYCMSREKCGSRAGYVTCNPLVYGPGVCAPQGAAASKLCNQNARSANEIRAYVLSHKQEFSNLRRDLSTVCTTVKNPTVCQAIQFRVNQMYSVVSGQLPAPTRVTTPATAAVSPPAARPAGSGAPGVRVPPPRRPGTQASNGGADGDIAPSIPVNRPPQVSAPARPAAAPASAPAAAPSSAAPATRPAPEEIEGGGVTNCPAYNRGSGRRCEATALMQPLTGPQDTSWAGKTLMTLEEAQAFYCRTEPINPEFLTATRSFLRTQQARVRNTSVVYDNCTEKRDKQRCIRNTNAYYQCFFKQMEDNFNACLTEAQANRAAGRIPNESAVGVELTYRGNIIDYRLTGVATPYSTSTVESYLGLNFGLHKVDLCKVRVMGTSAPAQSAPAVNSSGAAPGPAGSAPANQ